MCRVPKDPRHVRFMASVMMTAVFLTTACSAPATEEAPQVVDAIVFEGARLIVGDGTDPIENSAFVVQDGVITALGEAGVLLTPAGARRVDLTGKTVMPAIVDAHKHVSADREELVEQLERFAYYGVGMVMSLGLDQGDLAAQVQEETIPNAARLRTAGRGMTGEEPGRAPTPYWLTSEEEARAAVGEQAAAGIGLIKIWVDTRGGEYEKLTPELYGAVIDEAHANNMRVTAHIFELEDAKGLLEAGIDAFAHGVRDQDIDDVFIAMIQERPNVILVPNMPDRGVAVDMSWLSGSLTAQQVEQLQDNATDRPAAQESFGIQSRNLGRLNEAGMTIAFGTDGSTAWAAHVEMVDMVESGMTPAQVIVAATSNAAALLELDDVGMVAVGKSADFIVLNANPLDDITNTRQIDSVYLRGDMVDRATLSAQWTAEPSE